MAIIIPDPIVVPPQPEKVADKVWILTMNINANNGVTSPVTAYFSVAPYISSTGEILREKMEHINISDVFTACASNQTLAYTVGMIYNSVEALCKERRLFGMEPDPVIPTINGQPSNINTVRNQQSTFTVGASGYPLNYQWQKDSINLTDDTNINGSTSATLTIGNTTNDNTGSYNVIVSNILGSVTSSIATLTVTIPTPVIAANPFDRVISIGNSATFNVVIESTSDLVTYQWTKDSEDLVDGGDVSGSTTDTLTISNVTENSLGSYAVKVSTEGGTVTSTTAFLTIV